MSKTKKKRPTTTIDRFKIETAKELGLWPKIKQVGWGGLSTAESGRIGGYMTRKLRKKRLKNLSEYLSSRSKKKRQS